MFAIFMTTFWGVTPGAYLGWGNDKDSCHGLINAFDIVMDDSVKILDYVMMLISENLFN